MARKFPRWNTKPIAEMAEREIRRLLETLAAQHPCLAAKVIHRIGIIPAGETAIYVGIASRHRGKPLRLLAEFMDRLKQDVPIWKRRALPVESCRRRRDAVSQSAELQQPETPHVVLLQIARTRRWRKFIRVASRCRRPRSAGRIFWPRAARNGLRAGRFARLRPLDARRLRDFAK